MTIIIMIKGHEYGDPGNAVASRTSREFTLVLVCKLPGTSTQQLIPFPNYVPNIVCFIK